MSPDFGAWRFFTVLDLLRRPLFSDPALSSNHLLVGGN